jgi:hypothetical protein
MPNPAVNFGEYRFKPDDVNWVMVVVTMAAFVIFFVLLGKYIYRYDPDYVVPENIDPSLNGIRGWLLLPAFGIIVSPIRLVADSGSLLYIFSATQWSILVDRFDGVGPLIIIAGEIVANIGLLVMSIYLIFMLFQKRNTFPRFFIVYMIAGFIIVLSDTLALQYIFENMDQTEASNIRELVQIGMSTIIWGSYFVLSKRVKATFTQRREKSIATG